MQNVLHIYKKKLSFELLLDKCFTHYKNLLKKLRKKNALTDKVFIIVCLANHLYIH